MASPNAFELVQQIGRLPSAALTQPADHAVVLFAEDAEATLCAEAQHVKGEAEAQLGVGTDVLGWIQASERASELVSGSLMTARIHSGDGNTLSKPLPSVTS